MSMLKQTYGHWLCHRMTHGQGQVNTDPRPGPNTGPRPDPNTDPRPGPYTDPGL